MNTIALIDFFSVFLADGVFFAMSVFFLSVFYWK